MTEHPSELRYVLVPTVIIPVWIVPEPSKSMIWNRSSPCAPNASSSVWYTMRLSPTPQRIGIYSSPFCARCICWNQTFSSGGGKSLHHGPTTWRAYFYVNVNALLRNLIQGGESLQIPTGIFGSLFPASQITAQEAAAAVPIVIPVKRGLQHCTSWLIMKNTPPSGGGANQVHGSTMLQVCVYIFVLSPFRNIFVHSVYILFVYIYFLIRSYLCYTLFILCHFFHETILIYVMYIFLL